MKNFMLPIAAALALTGMACKTTESSNARDVVLWVNSAKVDCVGVGPTTCLRVQEGEALDDSKWVNLFNSINGFTYEPGFIYKLNVRIEKLDPATVPADASTLRYQMLELLEKKEDTRLRLHDIWALQSIRQKDLPDSAKGKPYIEIHVNDNRLMGNGGCNQLFGKVSFEGAQGISLSEVGSTKMACPELKTESEFLQLLQTVKLYEIRDLMLYLKDAQGAELLKLKKVD